MGRPILLGFLVILLLSSPLPASAQPAAEAPHSSEAAYELPPLQFSAVDRFVSAIAVEDEVALMIDPFWQPAIAALVAANPDKAELARSFGSDQRMAELTMFRPIVAMMLDHDAIELLNPDVRRRLAALQERRSAEYSRTRSISDERALQFSRKAMRIRSKPAARVNAQFQAMAGLARTPDGIALRELYRRGYFFCVGKDVNEARSARRNAECAQLEKSPALERIRKAALGEKLILVHGAAYFQLAGMVAMAHDPGISLHLLLPPEKVRAAGLNVPADLSLEELTSRHLTRAGGLHD